MPINKQYDEPEVKKAVAKALGDFYKALIRKMDELEITSIMKSKNPYLYRSKAMQSASEIVESVLQAFVSSSEETIFGNCFFEPIAIVAANGAKSISTGIDLEATDPETGVRYAIAVKSGTSTFNADSKKKQEDNFKNVLKLAQQGKFTCLPIVGYAYGQKREAKNGVPKIYQEVAGEDFWTLLTGDKDFYKKIICYMDHWPEHYVDGFKESYAKASNRLVRDFSNTFCRPDGSIDWDKLVEYNSGSISRQAAEEADRIRAAVIAAIKGDPHLSKKKIADAAGVSPSKASKVIEEMVAEGKLRQEGTGRKNDWTLITP